MRLYHPKTLQILASRPDIPLRYSTSVWSEIFKWKSSNKSHPKVFIYNDTDVGVYLRYCYDLATNKGAKLDKTKILKLNQLINDGFNNYSLSDLHRMTIQYFDKDYLFSDAVSLYLKGINIFPDIFGVSWKKYCPIISHKEIVRVVNKHLK